MSTSISTQGNFARLMQEGVNSVATMHYNDYEYQAGKIFETQKSSKAYELDVSGSGTGLGALKPEGTETSYDAPKQDFVENYQHKVYSLGSTMTMEAIMNNNYFDLAVKTGKMLKRSLVHTDEQLAADVINNGYDSSFVMGDGVPLFSTAHVLGKGGTFSNRFSVFTPLSQAAVEDAIINIRDFRDGAGLLINAKPVSLHIPPDLQFTADRILKSTYQPDSANTATINPVRGIFPKGYHVNDRFTSSTEWFIKTDVDDGFKIFERMGYTFSQDNDFGTENLRVKGMFYKSYGATDPRCCYGSGQ